MTCEEDFYPYRFEAEVSIYDVGSERYVYTVLWLPEAMQAALPLETHPRLRVKGEMNEVEFASALMPVPGDTVPGTRGKRRWYLLLSADRLRDMGDGEPVGVGDAVRVGFRLDDQDAVDMPVELQAALRGNKEAKAKWEALTPGKQRGLAYQVSSAKRSATRQKRVMEVLDTLCPR